MGVGGGAVVEESLVEDHPTAMWEKWACLARMGLGPIYI